MMIIVNEVQIPEPAIMAEMQYHPADSKRTAMLKAAESLVIGELLRQRAAELGLEISTENNVVTENNYLDALLAREVQIPTATDVECEQYYKLNPQRFTSSPLLVVRHILLEAATEDYYARV